MFANLRDWCCERGAEWNSALEVRDGSRGRGVFTTEAIAAGDLLLRLPPSLIISPSGRIAELVERGECSKLLALTLTHMHESHVAEPRKPYFGDLASQRPPDVPLRWAEADLAHLVGTSLLPRGFRPADASAAAAAHFAEVVLPAMRAAGEAALPSALHERGAFESSLCWVISRCLLGRVSYEHGHASLWPYLGADAPSASSRHGAGPFLLPLFDLINHSADAAARSTVLARVDGDDGRLAAFEMRATRPLGAGEEVLQSYGAHGSAELLRTYGFVERSPHTRVAVGIDELLAAARAQRGAGGGGGGGRGGRLAPKRGRARAAALEAAQLLPAAGIFMVGGGEDGGGGGGFEASGGGGHGGGEGSSGGGEGGREAGVDPALLTAVQVLVMEEEEYAEWEAAGRIGLGPEYLDQEHLPDVVGCLLRVVAERLRLLQTAQGAPPPPEAAEAGAAAAAAAALSEAVKREERRVLERLKAAALQLEAADEGEEGEEEGEEEEEEGEEEEGEEEGGEECGEGLAGGEEERGDRKRRRE